VGGARAGGTADGACASSSTGAEAARVARERWATGGGHRRSGCARVEALERGRRCRVGAAACAGAVLGGGCTGSTGKGARWPGMVSPEEKRGRI
jgi:hypothetical protein